MKILILIVIALTQVCLCTNDANYWLERTRRSLQENEDFNENSNGDPPVEPNVNTDENNIDTRTPSEFLNARNAIVTPTDTMFTTTPKPTEDPSNSVNLNNIRMMLFMHSLNLSQNRSKTTEVTENPRTQTNCTGALCIFNILASSIRPDLVNVTSTLPTTTYRSNDESHVIPHENVILTTTLRSPTTEQTENNIAIDPQVVAHTTRRYNFEPNQESNVAPAHPPRRFSQDQESTLRPSTRPYYEQTTKFTTTIGNYDPNQESHAKPHISKNLNTPKPTDDVKDIVDTNTVTITEGERSTETPLYIITDRSIATTSTSPKNIGTEYSSRTISTTESSTASTATTTTTTTKTTTTVAPIIGNDDYDDSRVLILNPFTNLLNKNQITNKNEDKNEDETPTESRGWVITNVQNKDSFTLLSPNELKNSLSKCGVFAVCTVSVYANETSLYRQLDGIREIFEHEENGGWDKLPIALSYSAKVNCAPKDVNGIIAFNIILIILIVSSNLFIGVVTLKSKVLHKPHCYFKMSLAAADMITGVITLPSITANIVRLVKYDGREDLLQMKQTSTDVNQSEAVVFGVVAVLSQIITVYSILLLSIDSFISIKWPVKYAIGDLMTTKRSVVLIGITWAFALVVSALPILGTQYVEYGINYVTMAYTPILKPSSTEGSIERFTHGIVYIVLVWGLPFIATWLITLLTAFYSKTMLNKMKSISHKSIKTTHRTISQLNKDILKTVAVVLLLFTITVLPLFIVLIIQVAGNTGNPICNEKTVTDGFFATYYVLVCGSFLNVIVYNVCNIEFRKESKILIRKMMGKCFGRCIPSLSHENTMSSYYSKKSRATRTTTVSNGKSKTSKKSLNSQNGNDNNNSNQTSTRPQTIGWCGNEKPKPLDNNSHDIYYSEIVGHANPAFEMLDVNEKPKPNKNDLVTNGTNTPRSVSTSSTASSRYSSSFSKDNKSSKVPPLNLSPNLKSPQMFNNNSMNMHNDYKTHRLPSGENCVEYTI